MEAGDGFFDRPILNSPYEYPAQHWELDESGQPTNRILDRRRQVSFITPIPAPKKVKDAQRKLGLDAAASHAATEDQQYELAQMILPHRIGPPLDYGMRRTDDGKEALQA